MILTSGIYVWQLISTVRYSTMPYLIWEKQTNKIKRWPCWKGHVTHSLSIHDMILDVLDIDQKSLRNIFSYYIKPVGWYDNYESYNEMLCYAIKSRVSWYVLFEGICFLAFKFCRICAIKWCISNATDANLMALETLINVNRQLITMTS